MARQHEYEAPAGRVYEALVRAVVARRELLLSEDVQGHTVSFRPLVAEERTFVATALEAGTGRARLTVADADEAIDVPDEVCQALFADVERFLPEPEGIGVA